MTRPQALHTCQPLLMSETIPRPWVSPHRPTCGTDGEPEPVSTNNY